MSLSSEELTKTISRMNEAVREQDYGLAARTLLQFQTQFEECRHALQNDRPGSELFLQQSAEAVKSALQVCTVHRQMLAELLSRVSVSSSYCYSPAAHSQSWQVDL